MELIFVFEFSHPMLGANAIFGKSFEAFCGAEGENNILADDSVGRRKAGDSAKMSWNQII